MICNRRGPLQRLKVWLTLSVEMLLARDWIPLDADRGNTIKVVQWDILADGKYTDIQVISFNTVYIRYGNY